MLGVVSLGALKRSLLVLIGRPQAVLPILKVRVPHPCRVPRTEFHNIHRFKVWALNLGPHSLLSCAAA